jgi:hypothetical protein
VDPLALALDRLVRARPPVVVATRLLPLPGGGADPG